MQYKLHPNPIFARENYIILDGYWDFIYKNNQSINDEEVLKLNKFDEKINVPFTYETEKSGINDHNQYDTIWYGKDIDIDLRKGNPYLNFEGVDYYCEVYLNSKLVGTNKGGYTPFAFSLLPYAKNGKNRLVVKVNDS